MNNIQPATDEQIDSLVTLGKGEGQWNKWDRLLHMLYPFLISRIKADAERLRAVHELAKEMSQMGLTEGDDTLSYFAAELLRILEGDK